MEILIIASYPDSLVKFRGDLINKLLKNGLIVHVAAPDLSNNSIIYKELVSRGVNVEPIFLKRTSLNPLYDILSLISLTRLFLKIKPDIVLCYTIKPIIYGIIVAWLFKVQRRYVLITGLGYMFTKKDAGIHSLIRIIINYLYKIALKRTHKVFFQNKDDQRLFYTLGLIDEMKPSVVVNGSGVDLNYYEVCNLPKGPPHFLMIARLLSSKGVREYVEAAKYVSSLYQGLSFTLVGWLDDSPDSIDKKELDIWIHEGKINYLGYLDDVRSTISKCSVYVLPSYREGTPRTVLEAMAMGRAIITTDVPGCRETIINGENGILISPKSVGSIADAMVTFINNPDLINSMGLRSRYYAEFKYDVNKINALMLKEMGLE